jgi:HD-GYP domain-containing protein (c-di-GMP phosphodiesterase class II)
MTIERLTPANYFRGNINGEIPEINLNQSQKIDIIRKSIYGQELNFKTLGIVIHQCLGNYDVLSEAHCYRTSQEAYESFIQMDYEFTQQLNPVDVKIGALLHDIGKYCVDKKILTNNGILSRREVDTIKLHPLFSHKILNLPNVSNTVLDLALYHHEKWDGSGYPHGLKGEEIPKVVRMFSIVDVWDALISERFYRQSIPHKNALKMIMGKEFVGFFDPKILHAFVKSKSYFLNKEELNNF